MPAVTTGADGLTSCDRCGGTAGNGGVVDAVVLSDLDHATGGIVNLHFCRQPQGKDGRARTCADIVVTTATTAKDAGQLDYPRSPHAAARAAEAVAATPPKETP